MRDLEKKILELNLSDKVHQLGNLSNSDVIKLMQNHQIFCFTSDRSEGWGAVLGEAMSNACSVSCIYSGRCYPIPCSRYKRAFY